MVAIPTYLLAASTTITALPLPTNPSPSRRALASQDSPAFYSSLQQVLTSDFPDPALLHVAGTTYAYSTNSGPLHIPLATSTDNVTFTLTTTDALPQLAPWENPTHHGVWAPDVVQLADSSFLMYYASGTLSTAGKYHCIGAATSSSPSGPFIPRNEPLICPDGPSTGGAIDPDGFLDPATGKRYIVYKLDGNANGHGGSCNNGVAPLQPTPLILQEVDAQDGITLIGAPTTLLDRGDADGPLIEAPSLVRSDEGVYFLFFASNCFSSELYATSYATSVDGVAGPYVKAGRPLLVTGDVEGLVGPGGLDVAQGGGGLVGFHGAVRGGSVEAVEREEGIGAEDGEEEPLVRGAYVARARFEGREVSFEV